VRLQQVMTEYTQHFSEYEYSKAKDVVENFFWHDLCDNYLEMIKARCYGANANVYKHENHQKTADEISENQLSAMHALRIVIKAVLHLFAPFMPFTCDEIWLSNFTLKGKNISEIDVKQLEQNSVHKQNGLKIVADKVQSICGEVLDFAVQSKQITATTAQDAQQCYINIGTAMLAIIAEVRKYKAENKLAANAPLQKMEIVPQTANIATLPPCALFDLQTVCGCLSVPITQSTNANLFV
jgi:valyl-tRNA synthetase